MGAWGFGLFDSDHDLDLIWELNDDAGLTRLEEEAKKSKNESRASESNGENEASEQQHQGAFGEDEISYSMYCSHCSDPTAPRDHHDAGALSAMLEKYETELLSGECGDTLRDPGYKFMLAGACAMTLGCHIPARSKETMKQVYMCVSLPHDGVLQMKKALHGPGEYQDGVPYDFSSLGLIGTMEEAHSALPSRGGLINVPGPGGLFYNPPKGDKSGLQKLRARYNDERYGANVCGGCGAEDGKEGIHLRSCARCKGRKYCSKACQKKQWPTHKEVCVEATNEETV